MDKQNICRCVTASILSNTAAPWAQTPVGLGLSLLHILTRRPQ